MKRILVIYFFLALSAFFAFSAYATSFVEGFEDIPLMDGLKQISSQDFSFHNEETGYTEAMLGATKRYKFADVKEFYGDILPKFGWNPITSESNRAVFHRENDILEISEMQKSPLKVLISLKSKN